MNIPSTEQTDNKPIVQSVQPNRFSGIKILVVDDEVDSLEILTLILEQEGAKVIPASSAKQAFEAFKNSIPDLIISDIGMSETDGYTLMIQIRALPQGEETPAIALTAYAGEIDRQHSFDAGFQKHIFKPVNIPELIAAIVEVLP